MPPSRTGVVTSNNYSDPAMWGVKYQEFVYGAIGSGLGIGDYDADGRPDIYVVSKTEGCRLFRNLGDWKFEDVTDRAGVSGREIGWADKARKWVGLGGGTPAPTAWQQGATFVDVDNDGRLDLYVCRFGAPNLLFRNQGDGTFKESAQAFGLDVSDASNMAAFADYDRDGFLDLYLQTNLLDTEKSPAGQRDYLFRNTGNGTFTNVTDNAGISGVTQGHSATWWDYDRDGWPDIYIANDFGPADTLYRNNRDGSFTNTLDQVVPHTPHSSMGADLGDLNNDGLIDLLVADMAATTHQKDQRGMAKVRSLLNETEPGSSGAPQYMRGALFLNTGTGRMLEAAQLAGLHATDWTWSVRLEDLDNDGRLDAHFTNGMVRELHNADLVQRISASESVAESIRVMKASPPLAEPNLAFRNQGDLQFENVTDAWGLGEQGVSFGAAFGDLDGDGDLDLAYVNYDKGLTLLRNDSDSGHRVIIALQGGSSNRFGVGASVKIETASGVQVRTLVLARGYLSSSEPVLHFGLGSDSEIARLTIEWPSGQVQTFEHLLADRHYTITEPTKVVGTTTRPGVARLPVAAHDAEPRNLGKVSFLEVSGSKKLSLGFRELPDTNRSSQALLPRRFDRAGSALSWGDLNGDRRPDLIVGGTTLDARRILLASPTGSFETAVTPALSRAAKVDDGPILILDANSDGRMDILVTKAGVNLPADAEEYQPQLFLNDGTGNFSLSAADVLPPLPMSVGAATAVDFNHDGRLDLFLGGRLVPGRYPMAPRSALLANRDGKWEDATDVLAPGLRGIGMVTSALWSDVDDDGWSDLLVALEWGGVRYWRNRSGRGFDDLTDTAGFSSGGTGWWTSLAAADFNGDGRLDYVAGNVGLNTPYRASSVQPATLFAGDFTGGGSTQLVEAEYEDGQLYPRRSRAELGANIPSVLKRFPKNDAYARATLREIVGEDRLAGAQRFSATEFQSGVFLSQPDGTYRFKALPRMAQIAPLQGMVAGDFDGDGHADIYAVQNSFAPIPSVGRFDGGLSQLLCGDGRGNFSVAAPLHSKLVVPGDAKALTVTDLNDDGWPDFVVSRTDGPPLAFQNERVAGRRSVRISLRGSIGNAAAIGARVTLELTDGTLLTNETAAGSGYLSQSVADCFFGYTELNPPRLIRVRWPTGQTSERALTAVLHQIELTAPPR